MSLVDAHVHVFARLVPGYPRPVEPHLGADRQATVDELLAAMQAHGIGNAGIVAVSPHDRYVAESARAHPGVLAAIGVFDDHAGDPVTDLESRVQGSGLAALRVFRLGPQLLPLFERMAELGTVLWLYPTADQLPAADRLAAALPDLRIVLNHLGFCADGELTFDEHGLPRRPNNSAQTLPSVLRLARHANVHVLFSGHYAFSAEPYPFSDLAPVSQAVADAFGADRLLWGSDYPWIVEHLGYRRLIDLVDEQLPGLTEAEREQILGGTARRLLAFASTLEGAAT